MLWMRMMALMMGPFIEVSVERPGWNVGRERWQIQGQHFFIKYWKKITTYLRKSIL